MSFLSVEARWYYCSFLFFLLSYLLSFMVLFMGVVHTTLEHYKILPLPSSFQPQTRMHDAPFWPAYLYPILIPVSYLIPDIHIGLHKFLRNTVSSYLYPYVLNTVLVSVQLRPQIQQQPNLNLKFFFFLDWL